MNVRNPIPGLIDAINAFWGLPMIVRLLPIFELVATAIKKGSVLWAPRFLHRFNTNGVSIRQVVSLVSTADVAADNQHRFRSNFVGEAVSNSSSTYFQIPVSCSSVRIEVEVTAKWSNVTNVTRATTALQTMETKICASLFNVRIQCEDSWFEATDNLQITTRARHTWYTSAIRIDKA